MADQLSSLYVASLFLALIGVLVCVNALLASGLRWFGRRITAFWRRTIHRDTARSQTDAAPLAPFDATTTAISPDRPSADQPPGRYVPR